MIELVHAGRTPEELAHEFEPTAQSIRNWVAQWERNAGRGDGGLTTAEREELSRLRRENRQLRLEWEILSKAAPWFARETNAIPPKGSGSRGAFHTCLTADPHWMRPVIVMVGEGRPSTSSPRNHNERHRAARYRRRARCTSSGTYQSCGPPIRRDPRQVSIDLLSPLQQVVVALEAKPEPLRDFRNTVPAAGPYPR